MSMLTFSRLHSSVGLSVAGRPFAIETKIAKAMSADCKDIFDDFFLFIGLSKFANIFCASLFVFDRIEVVSVDD